MKNLAKLALVGFSTLFVSCATKEVQTVYYQGDAEVGLEDVHEFPNGVRFHVKSAVRYGDAVTLTVDSFTIDKQRSTDFDKDSLKVVIDGLSYLPYEVLGKSKVNPNRTYRLLISLSTKQYRDLKWRTLDRRNVGFEVDFLN